MDVALTELWLPIVLSAVAVFIASFLAWAVLPHHKPDWVAIPEEASFLDSIRGRITAGQYMFPYCQDPAKMEDPAFKEYYRKGPHGVLTVWPGPTSMVRNLAASVVFYIVVGVFVAYVTSHAVGRDAEYLAVFRIAGTAAFMAYCLGFIPHAIWFNTKLRSITMDVLDGTVYALLTAGIFAWRWGALTPAAGA